MSDYLENLWTQFAVEAQEHLDLIEPLLVSAEVNSLDRDAVDQLFRSFHSIKGMAKAMDLLGMEAIAHHAEDILGLVRDQTLQMTPPLAGLMLSAVDALKQHLDIAETERRDQDPNADIISQLTQACKDAGQQEQAAVADMTELAEMETAAISSAMPLHADQDMLIFFAELLQNKLPTLAELLSEPGGGEAAQGQLVDNLETLTHAAATMNFPRLSQEFARLGESSGPKSEARRATVMAALAHIIAAVGLIKRVTQLDCGLSALTTDLRSQLSEEVEGLFSQLSKMMSALSALLSNHEPATVPKEEVVQQIASLDSQASALQQHLNVIGDKVIKKMTLLGSQAAFLKQHLDIIGAQETAQGLLANVVEVCRLVEKGELTLTQAINEPLSQMILGAQQCYSSEFNGAEDSFSSTQAKAVEQRLWDSVKAQLGGDGSPTFEMLGQQIEINPAFEPSLSPQQIRLLQQCLDGGGTVYEVLINLDKSAALTTRFVEWLTTDVQVVTNRDLTIDGESWSEFLLFNQQSEALLRAQVKALDPKRELIKIKPCAVVAQDSGENTVSPGPATATSGAGKELNSLRISGATLDQFISQLGELVSIRSMLNHTVHAGSVTSAFQALKQQLADGQPLATQQGHLLEPLELLEQQFRLFDQIDQKMHTVLGQLQESALALRVVPMENVFKRFPRIVRDIAHAQDKQVTLTLTGQEVRIDKAMVEVLHEPLMHMVRNSVDHGIELPQEREAAGKPQRAQISLEAHQQSNSVVVTIRDDGRGINLEAVRAKALANGLASEEELAKLSPQELTQFIFHAGFSTVTQITETSGRGVGMDVVRTNVNRLGGKITVSSIPGQGTTFTLELPLTTAIQDTLLVQTYGQMMAIPERYVTEMIEIQHNDLQLVKGCQAIVLRNSFLPVYPLGQLLGYDPVQGTASSATSACGEMRAEQEFVVTVLSDGKQSIGLMVDRSYQRQELFIKDIHEQLIALPGVSGASVLGDGRVVLVLDVEDLFQLAAKHGRNASIDKTRQVA